jgi:hypothetical protein
MPTDFGTRTFLQHFQPFNASKSFSCLGKKHSKQFSQKKLFWAKKNSLKTEHSAMHAAQKSVNSIDVCACCHFLLCKILRARVVLHNSYTYSEVFRL